LCVLLLRRRSYSRVRLDRGGHQPI